jgi:hypothetical protein
MSKPTMEQLIRWREAAIKFPESKRILGFDPDQHMDALKDANGDVEAARQLLIALKRDTPADIRDGQHRLPGLP